MATTLAAPSAQARIEDLEWMASTGESLQLAAHRLGLTPLALERFAYRYGRGDLIRILRSRDPILLATESDAAHAPVSAHCEARA